MIRERLGWRRGRDVSAELDHLRGDLGRLRQDLGKLTAAIWRLGKGSSVQSAQKLREPASRWVASARQGGDRLAQTLESHPWASVMSAAVLGIVVAALLTTLGLGRRRGRSYRPSSESRML